MTKLVEPPRPLAISCKATRCDKGVPKSQRRHAFSSPVSELPGIAGSCISCGASLIDWERLYAHDPNDLEALVRALRLELIRDNYWGLELPVHVLRKGKKRSSEQLQVSIQRVLRGALKVDHILEGRQTPFAYNEASATIIMCAQHGTGTCCRECLEKWYGYPRTSELATSDYGFLADVVWRYVDERLATARGPEGVAE